MATLRRAVRAAVPQPIRRYRAQRILRRMAAPFDGASNAEIFAKVYDGPFWGNTGSTEYTSGYGSDIDDITAPYLAAITAFLGEFDTPPNVVDLGCGDFRVGSRVRPLAGRYTAGDVVPKLIERNRESFAALDVDFRLLDIARDPLPAGDVVFIRQVLQHLSNADIAAVVAKLPQFGWAVITEHLPRGRFQPNHDLPSGPFIRLGLDSGVDLAEPPFSLPFTERRVLCEADDDHSIIRTTAYRLG